jgi:hypothetical protein
MACTTSSLVSDSQQPGSSLLSFRDGGARGLFQDCSGARHWKRRGWLEERQLWECYVGRQVKPKIHQSPIT